MIDIKKEVERFKVNWEFNHNLTLRAEMPLARWAYGACKEWVSDFESSAIKTNTMKFCTTTIRVARAYNSSLKDELKRKFSDYEYVGLIK